MDALIDTDIIDRIEQLFADHGRRPYDGARRESVTALDHALQCAQLAEWAQAEPALVAAALLHDVGHLLVADAAFDHIDDCHEDVAQAMLRSAFGPAVTEPVRLHVQAKRYLVLTDPDYAGRLSPASVHTLGLQGGPMDSAQAAIFRALPHAEAAIALRRWDDLAKEAGRPTPPLAYYLALLEEVLLQPWIPPRTVIGALDA